MKRTCTIYNHENFVIRLDFFDIPYPATHQILSSNRNNILFLGMAFRRLIHVVTI